MWEYYQGFQCSVLIAGGATEWFVAEQGVHQGGPFSMRLYVIFNSDLLDQLRYSMYGVRISNLPYSTCCPAYADDVAIVNLHKPNLQKLLDIAYQHSCSWRYCFNPKKSHVLIFGVDRCPSMDLYIGIQKLNIVAADKHLGIPLATDRAALDRSIQAFISRGRRSFYASLSLGSRYNPIPH